MKTIDILKTLDRIALQSNQVWNQCESLKMRIIEDEHISPKRLEENGIFFPKKGNK